MQRCAPLSLLAVGRVPFAVCHQDSAGIELTLICAAGADLSELAHISTAEAFQRGWLKDLNDVLDTFRKPTIAAVRGFAVGAALASFKVSTDESKVWWRLRTGTVGKQPFRIIHH